MLRRTLLRLLAFSAPALCVSAAIAQDEKAEEKPPLREDFVLQTTDGVRLAASFYPSPKKEGAKKETVPVILLHMWKGSRNDYAGLAVWLQQQGHAVLVPDLRGHGDSTSKRGSTVPLSATTLSPNEFQAMVYYDMPVLKQFLVRKNNAGELNIEKLCLVGAELGATVALNFTLFDWTRPAQGNMKQGQDVKALVLISPEWSIKGTRGLTLGSALAGQPLTTMVYDPQLRAVLKDPDAVNFQMPVTLDFRREVSVYIIFGKGRSKVAGDARRLRKMLEAHRHDPPDLPMNQRDLFSKTMDTTLQGTKMLGVRGLDLERRIAMFIDLRLVKRFFPRAVRKNPYE